MPKATGKARKVAGKTTKGKAASGKPTFTCACTGGCKGRTQELSEALYKKHAKFRELDEATDKDNMDARDSSLASPQQANIQHSQHDDSVSFQIAIQATSLRYILFSPLVLCLSSLRHQLRPLLNYPSLNHFKLPHWRFLITPTVTHCRLFQPTPAALRLVKIYQIHWQLHIRTVSLSIAPLRRSLTTTPLILIPDVLIWIPAAEIVMLVLSWTRRILHW